MKIVKMLVVLLAMTISAVAWAEEVVEAVEVVNINTANAETLAAGIRGVGEKLSQAIVNYRNEHGAFETVDDLANVRGIGPVMINKNRDRLTVGEPAADAEPAAAESETPQSQQGETSQ